MSLSAMEELLKNLDAGKGEDDSEPNWEQVLIDRPPSAMDCVFHPDLEDRQENAPLYLGRLAFIFKKKWKTAEQRRWREYDALNSMGCALCTQMFYIRLSTDNQGTT